MLTRFGTSHGPNFRSSIKLNTLNLKLEGKVVHDDAEFQQWKDAHTVIKDQKPVTGLGSLLLIYAAIRFKSSVRATHDEDGNPWDSEVSRKSSGALYYNGSTITISQNSSAHGTKMGKSKAHIASGDSHSHQVSFQVCTYNCLYSRADGTLCEWETEMIPKTEEYGPQGVRESNLPWAVRGPRIATALANGGLPDVIMLQEVTPKMLTSLRSLAGMESFSATRSHVGCCESSDGYTYVLLNPEAFKVVRTETNVGGNTRASLVRATHLSSGNGFVFGSLHLPASGHAEQAVNRIEKAVDKLRAASDAVVIAGDFNVTYNPFKGLTNISGQSPTFFNDDKLKLDWVVASKQVKRMNAPTLNSIVPSQGRWPNAIEGSDHTCVKVTIAVPAPPPPSTGAASSSSAAPSSSAQMPLPEIKVEETDGSQTVMRLVAMPGTWHNFRETGNTLKLTQPMYFAERARLASKQARREPTLLMSSTDFKMIAKDVNTHSAAFGLDTQSWPAKSVSAKVKPPGALSGNCTVVWKFPSDLNYLPGFRKIFNVYLPVGDYPFWDDEWWNEDPYKQLNLSELPRGVQITKFRRDGDGVPNTHHLEVPGKVRVAAISTTEFIPELWEEDWPSGNTYKTKVSRLLQRLLKAGVYTISVYGQHHVLVFYADVDQSPPTLITPCKLSTLLQSSRAPRILKALYSEALSKPRIDAWAKEYQVANPAC